MVEIVVSIGAHPDDYELGCGGTLRKHIIQGDIVYGIVMCRGENGNHCPDGHECKASSKVLGLTDIEMLDYRDGYIKHDAQTVTKIEEVIKKIKPDIVYGHTRQDNHQDHRNCALATLSASRSVQAVLLYETPSSIPGDFKACFFSDISDTINDKIEALSHYTSQMKKGIVDLERVKSLADMWGWKVKATNHGAKYVEAFEVYRIVR